MFDNITYDPKFRRTMYMHDGFCTAVYWTVGLCMVVRNPYRLDYDTVALHEPFVV